MQYVGDSGTGEMITCDRNTTEAEICLDSVDIGNSMIGTEHDRIRDKPVLKLFHFPHHFSLFIRCAIMMNHTKTTKQLSN